MVKKAYDGNPVSGPGKHPTDVFQNPKRTGFFILFCRPLVDTLLNQSKKPNKDPTT
jgi:hypothetical protein